MRSPTSGFFPDRQPILQGCETRFRAAVEPPAGPSVLDKPLVHESGEPYHCCCNLLRASVEARFEIIRAKHNYHKIEREMTREDCREKLGAVKGSAFEMHRREIDFKIIQIGSPSAQSFFNKFDGVSQMTSYYCGPPCRRIVSRCRLIRAAGHKTPGIRIAIYQNTFLVHSFRSPGVAECQQHGGSL